MAQFLAPIINDQQLDANGEPLSGGTISVYLAGSSTPATTYSDKAGLVPNTWPIVLNTLGVNNQGEVWITGGTPYKFVIKDSVGVVQRTLDNVSGINDTAVTADQWVVYQGTPTYVSATSFTVPGDQTQAFAPGTRVKTINTGGIVYGTVVRAVYSTATTVTIIPDGGTLDSGLSTVLVGIITATNPSLPGNLTTPPFRNRILNAQFRNDQRNAGASQALTAGATAYTVDRFYASCTGANASIRRVAGTGYQYAVTLTGAASVASSLFGQRIESFNCYDWANKQINVQAPISASGISSVTWNAYTADVSDNFTAKTLVATGTLTLSGTIETKYFSFSVGSSAIRGVAIEFVTGALGAGQSITFQGAIQAEANQVSTFEVIEVGEDLHRCQRYFQSSYDSTTPGSASATANRLVSLGASATTPGVQFLVKLPVRMRAAPSITLYNPTTGASGSMRNESAGADLSATTFGSPGIDYFGAYNSGAAAAVANIYGLHYTASAEL